MDYPKKMYGLVLTGHGGFEKMVWQNDILTPVPASGEVLVRVGASSINNTDVNTRVGWYSKTVRSDTASGAQAGYNASVEKDATWSGAAMTFPRIQGADCCGYIVGVGVGVSSERIGERVLVRALQSVEHESDGGRTVSTFGSECDGAFAQYTLVRASDALKIQSSLSDVELASFPCAFSTAEGMIQRAGLGQERVLITGASGGVGSAAIQLAKRRGAYVSAITSGAKAQELKALGADEIILRDATLPKRCFDVVLDLVGGARWGHLLDSLVMGGRYVVAGAIAGPIVELDLRTLYLRDLSFFGCTYQPDNIFSDLVGYIERGEVSPMLARTYPLRDMRVAQEAFLTKSHVGKIGITVSSKV